MRSWGPHGAAPYAVVAEVSAPAWQALFPPRLGGRPLAKAGERQAVLN